MTFFANVMSSKMAIARIVIVPMRGTVKGMKNGGVVAYNKEESTGSATKGSTRNCNSVRLAGYAWNPVSPLTASTAPGVGATENSDVSTSLYPVRSRMGGTTPAVAANLVTKG